VADEVGPEQGDVVPAPEGERNDKRAERSHDRFSVIATALVGIVGVVGTLAASCIQVDAQLQNQQAQFAEQRAKEERDKRATVYLGFLDKADLYANATESSRACFNRAREAAGPDSRSFEIGPECSRTIGTLAPTRHGFQGARNQVYVYGTQAAEDQAGLIAGYLPPAIGGQPESGLPELGTKFNNFDRLEFRQLYQDFQVIICREVPAQPRTACE
jgi:hypothetical protein